MKQTPLDRLSDKIFSGVCATVVVAAFVTVFAWAVNAPTYFWWLDGIVLGITLTALVVQVGVVWGRRHGLIVDGDPDED